jgi:uncharacterized protein YecE (DUF72 family)
MARVLIGTSGWHYDSWRGPFFPKGLPLKEQLPYYSSQFWTTELNGVFYRTPTPQAVTGWRDQTGRNFIFAWKASKFITHWKRLSGNSVNSLELLEDRLSLLGRKARPILFQLTAELQSRCRPLTAFFKLLSRKRRYSFEFRHPSWYSPQILRLLRAQNISLCISDHHDAPAPWKRTADFVYVRAHGPTGRYKGHYSARTLSEWARHIRSWKRQGCDVFVYFDNDQKSAAPADARALSELMGQAWCRSTRWNQSPGRPFDPSGSFRLIGFRDGRFHRPAQQIALDGGCGSPQRNTAAGQHRM